MSQRPANILALVIAGLWAGLFYIGRGLVLHVYGQGPGVHPNAGQIEMYVTIPAVIALALSAFAWLVNALQRGFAVLAGVALVAMLALFPYLLVYSGGV